MTTDTSSGLPKSALAVLLMPSMRDEQATVNKQKKVSRKSRLGLENMGLIGLETGANSENQQTNSNRVGCRIFYVKTLSEFPVCRALRVALVFLLPT